jgi:hypothetical protein
MKTLRAFLVIVVGLLCAIASFGSAAHAVCDPKQAGATVDCPVDSDASTGPESPARVQVTRLDSFPRNRRELFGRLTEAERAAPRRKPGKTTVVTPTTAQRSTLHHGY